METKKEERRARNAQYERERRKETARAMHALADAVGAHATVANAELLATVISRLRQHHSRTPRHSLAHLQRINHNLQSQIALLESRLNTNPSPQESMSSAAPPLAARAHCRKTVTKGCPKTESVQRRAKKRSYSSCAAAESARPSRCLATASPPPDHHYDQYESDDPHDQHESDDSHNQYECDHPHDQYDSDSSHDQYGSGDLHELYELQLEQPHEWAHDPDQYEPVEAGPGPRDTPALRPRHLAQSTHAGSLYDPETKYGMESLACEDFYTFKTEPSEVSDACSADEYEQLLAS